MRKHTVFGLLLIFMFSLLASIYPTHATSLIGLDQKTVCVHVIDLDVGASAAFLGTVTSYKDGSQYLITIDGDMAVGLTGGVLFCMPYWLDGSKSSPITKVEYTQYGGLGSISYGMTADKEMIVFYLFGWAGWIVHIECRFQDYGDPSVKVCSQAYTGEKDDWAESELKLSKVKAFLYLSASSGGTTNPAPGNYGYDYGSSVTVTASAYSGYYFNHWNLDGATDYDSPITVTMNSDHTLTAYFQYSDGGGGGGGGGCPTLFVWNGNGYVDYGVINIHNPSGEDIVREVPVRVEDVGINNHRSKFRLREGWEGLNFSESVIDQVKLYAVDSQGNRHLCPLISAEHSSLGNVLPQLLLSDDYRAQMLLLETVDLTFIVPWQNIQGFTFAIEGCNFSKL